MSILDDMSLADKESILGLIIEHMAQELEQVLKSAQAAHGGATHEDAVAKSKYDTHGLELSYLAGSQFSRAEKLKADLSQLHKVEIKRHHDREPIAPYCLVEVDLNQSPVLYFISLYGAGTSVVLREHAVQVVSPQAPLGREMLELYVGDELTVSKHSGVVRAVL